MGGAWLNKGVWPKQRVANRRGTSCGRGQAAPTPNNRRTNGLGCGGVVGGAKAGGGVAYRGAVGPMRRLLAAAGSPMAPLCTRGGPPWGGLRAHLKEGGGDTHGWGSPIPPPPSR